MARLPAAYLFLFLLLVQVVAEASLSEGKGPLPVQAKGGDEALYKNLYHKIKSSPKITGLHLLYSLIGQF
ncbi:hypothetical protein AMTR_s00017p00012220 [Amborella trichopoda]|uniref:Uncharacterized protein n=1 Tax=Amborella trichopoda TaxID=13333 RepID=W1PL73_AMBTC|nr:hypothetical protein AMTR_s00017p00012220 [Amborella trichopoda]